MDKLGLKISFIVFISIAIITTGLKEDIEKQNEILDIIEQKPSKPTDIVVSCPTDTTCDITWSEPIQSQPNSDSGGMK